MKIFRVERTGTKRLQNDEEKRKRNIVVVGRWRKLIICSRGEIYTTLLSMFEAIWWCWSVTVVFIWLICNWPFEKGFFFKKRNKMHCLNFIAAFRCYVCCLSSLLHNIKTRNFLFCDQIYLCYCSCCCRRFCRWLSHFDDSYFVELMCKWLYPSKEITPNNAEQKRWKKQTDWETIMRMK